MQSKIYIADSSTATFRPSSQAWMPSAPKFPSPCEVFCYIWQYSTHKNTVHTPAYATMQTSIDLHCAHYESPTKLLHDREHQESLTWSLVSSESSVEVSYSLIVIACPRRTYACGFRLADHPYHQVSSGLALYPSCRDNILRILARKVDHSCTSVFAVLFNSNIFAETQEGNTK